MKPMMLNVDLNDLYAFQALVTFRSFKAAAEAIHLSQPALSRRIEKLETSLGVRLFERTTRRVSLTMAGRSFAPRAQQILNDLESAIADVGEANPNRTGLVTVACVPSAAYYFMPRVIAQFQLHYPRVRIKLIDSSAGNVYDAVISGQADFGLSFTGAPQPDVRFLPLVDEAYVAVCPRDHPLAGRKSLSWREFYSWPYVWLDKTSGNRNLLDRALAGIVPEKPSVCETRHVTTLLGMVEAGLGIAAVPGMAMPKAGHPFLATLPLREPTVRRTVGIVKRTGQELPHLAGELEAMIIAMNGEEEPVSGR